MSWTDWTSGDWLSKWKPQWTPGSAPRLPDAITETMSRLVDVFGFSPAGFLNTVVSTASNTLVGRQLQTTIAGEKVQFVLDAFRVEPVGSDLLSGSSAQSRSRFVTCAGETSASSTCRCTRATCTCSRRCRPHSWRHR